jgi:(R,R)-butanediol dehydrogenase/meso-butanediol dehydrogenase/diacetyl reductase
VGGSTDYGGFGETVLVGESELYLLPKEVPLEYAAIIEPLAVVQHAIKVSGVKEWKGKDVLVLGGGPIGFALLLCLRAAGADTVITSEPAAARREQVTNLCSHVINPMEESVEQKCLEYTNGRAVEVVFDCAGVPVGLESAFDAIRFNGLYVMVAVWEKPVSPSSGFPCGMNTYSASYKYHA